MPQLSSHKWKMNRGNLRRVGLKAALITLVIGQCAIVNYYYSFSFLIVLDMSEICGSLTREDLQGLTPATAGWQNVSHDDDRGFLVYSAFWESRVTPPAVRILGLAPYSHNHGNDTWCSLWYAGQDQPELTRAIIQQLSDAKCVSSYLSCENDSVCFYRLRIIN